MEWIKRVFGSKTKVASLVLAVVAGLRAYGIDIPDDVVNGLLAVVLWFLRDTAALNPER